jgi:hypothetical protein
MPGATPMIDATPAMVGSASTRATSGLLLTQRKVTVTMSPPASYAEARTSVRPPAATVTVRGAISISATSCPRAGAGAAAASAASAIVVPSPHLVTMGELREQRVNQTSD